MIRLQYRLKAGGKEIVLMYEGLCSADIKT